LSGVDKLVSIERIINSTPLDLTNHQSALFV
jgi:hypothetical protein